MLREYVISEAMAALGIPTTRSLAVVTTGEPVYGEQALRGAVLTRVAASHIRVGTFEYAAARRDAEALRALADYAIAATTRSWPTRRSRTWRSSARSSDRQAALIAQWQLVGFIHGVMNTDNMAISGETIDYGPCAFMNAYDPATVFSSIDRRPLRLRQPAADRAVEPGPVRRGPAAALRRRPGRGDRAGQRVDRALRGAVPAHWLAGMRAKLGLVTEEPDDAALVDALLDWMHDSGATSPTRSARSARPAPPTAIGARRCRPSGLAPPVAGRLARQPQTADEVTP